MQIPQSSYLLLVHVYDVCVAVHMEVGEQLCGDNVYKGSTQNHLTSHKSLNFSLQVYSPRDAQPRLENQNSVWGNIKK